MHLGPNAEKNPDKVALIFPDSGETVTYRQLEERSNRLAQALRAWGLEPGDSVAAIFANEPAFFDAYWAVTRAGLYFTPVNWHLSADEMRYIVENCDARVLLASTRALGALGAEAGQIRGPERKIAFGGPIPGFEPAEEALAPFSSERIADEREGANMLYSSGTTGRPKGVRPPLGDHAPGTGPVALLAAGFSALFGFGENDVYLCPGPLYHAAPLTFTQIQQRIGATAVVMERFHPERALRYVQDHGVTTTQWVPTHFSRMLALPDDVKSKYDLSSMRIAIHAAAPCPTHVKQQMIDWWGPSIVEYYAGTEGGGTLIRSDEWLSHKGSVGKHWANARIHILDENGNEITEPHVDGAIYFEAPEDPSARFEYYKDEEKTRSTYRGRLFTIGDIGHLDEDGYLYLTDRKSHMIISGGVNIYPQEVENCLLEHPEVADVAVIGVPDDDMGEQVKAVVQLAGGAQGGEDLARELIAYARDRIAHYKAPRSVDFVSELPRLENGKIYKRLLRDRYWQGRSARI